MHVDVEDKSTQSCFSDSYGVKSELITFEVVITNTSEHGNMASPYDEVKID